MHSEDTARLTSEKKNVGPAVLMPRSVEEEGLDVNASPFGGNPLDSNEDVGASVAVKGEELPPRAPSSSVKLVGLNEVVIVTGESPPPSRFSWLADGTAVSNGPTLELGTDGAKDGEVETSAGAAPECPFVGAGGTICSSAASSSGNMVGSEGWPEFGTGTEGYEVLPSPILLLVVDGLAVGAAVGASEPFSPATQISSFGLLLGSVAGLPLGVAVVFIVSSSLSIPLDPEGEEEGADEVEPPNIPPAGLLLGCAVRPTARTDVGPAVAPFPLVSEVGEWGPSRVPATGLFVGVVVAWIETVATVGLKVSSSPATPALDGVSVGSNDGAPPGVPSAGLLPVGDVVGYGPWMTMVGLGVTLLAAPLG